MPPEPSPPTPGPSQSYRGQHTYTPSRVQQRAAPSATPQKLPQFTPPGSSFQPQQTNAYQPQPTPVQPTPSPNDPPASPYDFMTNSPQQPAGPRFSLPGKGASLPMRALLAAGGLLALIIVFSIVKGLFSSGSSFTPFVAVAQDQEELLHIVVGSALQQQNLSAATQNFSATTQVTIASAQGTLINYLVLNGQKVSPKVINLKVSLATDNQLQAAIAATTYEQTFQQVMQTKLNAYVSDLSQTYKQAKGKKGRALLTSDYNQAQLLLTQLNAASQ